MIIDGAEKEVSWVVHRRNTCKLTINVLFDALMRQDTATVHVNLISNRNVVSQYGAILQTCPAANCTVPANDCALDPCVLLDLAVLQQHASLQPHTIANDAICSDGDIRSDFAVVANLGRRVDHDVSTVHKGLGVGGEFLGALFGQRSQVEACTGEKVLGLTDVHPEALEVKAVQLSVLAHGREGFLLDRRRAEFDALEDGGVEDIDTSVDAVSDKLNRLLDETIDSALVARFVYNDSVFRWLFDLCDDDCALLAVRFVEVGELLEGVLADDIGV